MQFLQTITSPRAVFVAAYWGIADGGNGQDTRVLDDGHRECLRPKPTAAVRRWRDGN